MESRHAHAARSKADPANITGVATGSRKGSRPRKALGTSRASGNSAPPLRRRSLTFERLILRNKPGEEVEMPYGWMTEP